MPFTGLFVPLVTPFTDDGGIASGALQALAHEILDDGAAGVVALGTTAEAAALTSAERHEVLEVCARVSEERGVPLIVGTGSNSTARSVEMLAALPSQTAAALAVVPYHVRPSQDGVVEHFRKLAATSPVPLIVYHVPYRTGRPLDAAALLRIARIPNVVGFKHAVGGIDDATVSFMSELPAGTSVLAGDDLHAGPLLALGASGAIMASANVSTRGYAGLVAAWRDGPTERARGLHNRLVPLTHALFAEPNPVVIKAVLAAQGRIPTARVRLPHLDCTPDAAANALAHCDHSVSSSS